jgi:hypothetical protein
MVNWIFSRRSFLSITFNDLVLDKRISMEHRLKNNVKGNTKYFKQYRPSAQFVHYTFRTD